MTEMTKTFMVRCKEFFGQHPGQTLQDFARELRELTDQDCADLVELFNKAGMPTLPRAANLSK